MHFPWAFNPEHSTDAGRRSEEWTGTRRTCSLEEGDWKETVNQPIQIGLYVGIGHGNSGGSRKATTKKCIYFQVYILSCPFESDKHKYADTHRNTNTEAQLKGRVGGEARGCRRGCLRRKGDTG